MSPFRALLLFIRGFVRDRKELALENLALRQQLATLRHKAKRPRLRNRDRIFWSLLSHIWPDWRYGVDDVRTAELQHARDSGRTTYWRRRSRVPPEQHRNHVQVKRLGLNAKEVHAATWNRSTV